MISTVIVDDIFDLRRIDPAIVAFSPQVQTASLWILHNSWRQRPTFDSRFNGASFELLLKHVSLLPCQDGGFSLSDEPWKVLKPGGISITLSVII